MNIEAIRILGAGHKQICKYEGNHEVEDAVYNMLGDIFGNNREQINEKLTRRDVVEFSNVFMEQETDTDKSPHIAISLDGITCPSCGYTLAPSQTYGTLLTLPRTCPECGKKIRY